ncbi:MAG: signal peptidase II [Thermomicrobiales bacterium]
MSSDQSVTSTDRWKVFSAALSVVLVVDVLTKVVVTRKLGPDGDRDSIDVLSGFLSFSYTRNNGVAFGLLQGDSAIVWISVFLGLVLGGWFVVSAIESSSTLEIVALGCCAGGAVGNIANRLVSG